MQWLVEPLEGIRLLVETQAAESCTGSAVLNHCSCWGGLIVCDTPGDMKYKT